MAEIRFFIDCDTLGGWTAVTPINSGVFEYKREKDSMYISVTLKNELVFKGADFTTVEALPLLEEITVKAERRCGGTWSEYWRGYFYLINSKVDYDICTIRTQPKTDDVYPRFLEQWSEKVNFYTVPVVTVKPIDAFYEVQCCQAINYAGVPPAPFQTCFDMGDPGDWPFPPVSDVVELDPVDALTYTRTTCWHRVIAAGTCSGATPVAPPYGDGWVIMSTGNNCPTSSEWRGNPYYATTISELNYGRSLNAVLEDMAGAYDSLTGIVSDFFNINPDATAPSNDAYDFAIANLQKLTIHQKADVKRPFSSNPSLSISWEASFKDILNDLSVLFNVGWTITAAGELRIEHYSYFLDALGSWSISSDSMKRQLEGNSAELPKREIFTYADELASEYFLGYPVVYATGKDDREQRCTLISTDVGYIQETDNLDSIKDEGFCLVSCYEISGQRYVSDFNRPLAFSELHDALHRHNRAFEEAMSFNGGGVTVFDHWVKNRKQPSFTIGADCGDVPDLNQEAVTSLGTGEIESLDHDIVNCNYKLNIKY